MSVRFYNPGSKIYEKLAFDHPTNNVRDQNLISYWQFEAPERSFFDVPTDVEINTDEGIRRVAVDFAKRVRSAYRDYGVVQVDPKADPEKINPDDNVAVDGKEAKAKGELLWRLFLEAKAREHIENVTLAKGMGVPPRRAVGIYAQALRSLGLADPADQVGAVVESNKNTAENADLQRQINELKELLKKKG